MLRNLRSSARFLHTNSSSRSIVLYGWGQTQALPLFKGSIDRVYKQPTRLDKESDFALPQNEAVTHVATGWGHSLIGTESNQVYAFGLNQSGQLGNCLPASFSEPIQALACGREHSHIVTGTKDKTQLYSFGNNMYGQLGLGKNKNTVPGDLIAESEPKLVDFDQSIEHLVCGLDNTILATRGGLIYGMGWSADGQLGHGHDDKDVPSKLSLKSEIKKLSSSTDFTLALNKQGELWTWGNSEYGQGMQGKVIDRILEPLKIKVDRVVDIAAGGPFSVILTKDGNVYTCGYGSLGLGKETIQVLEPTLVKGLSNIAKIYAATDYAAAITKSGELYTWGLNGPSCRLGLGNSEHAFTPKHVSLDKEIIDLSLGTNHVLATCIE